MELATHQRFLTQTIYLLKITMIGTQGWPGGVIVAHSGNELGSLSDFHSSNSPCAAELDTEPFEQEM